MSKRNSLKHAELQLREQALVYPEAIEEFPWEHRAFKVKKKVFLFLSLFDDVLSLSLKLPGSAKAALALPFAEPTGYGLGKSGWVTAKFKPGDAIPLEMIYEWLDESYRAIAPAKIVAQLDGAAAKKPAVRSIRRSAKRARQ